MVRRRAAQSLIHQLRICPSRPKIPARYRQQAQIKGRHKMFNRRTVSAMLAGTVVAPSFAFAQSDKQKSAFYSGVGNELTHYEVDVANAELAKRGSIKMPRGIQYAWPHPSKTFLYLTSRTS